MFRIPVISLLTVINLYAGGFAIITNHKNPIKTLTTKEIKMIYLKKIRYWDNTKLVALNLSPNSSLREEFEKSILGLTPSQLDRYWTEQHYNGRRPPYRLDSVESMVIFIKRVDGAIGYIPLDMVDSSIKVLYRSSP